ncbi:MAG: hypothetical protein ABIH11_09195 [Candidatus Altiarchaeota archaeon]
MKVKTLFFAFMFSLFCGCVSQPTNVIQDSTSTTLKSDLCLELSKSFDANIDSVGAAECDEWASNGSKPIWVGGRLTSITKTYSEAYDRNEYSLTFKGLDKEGRIHIGSRQASIPYKTGVFYRFDLGNKCRLIYSMASSGMFSDPELNALKKIDECTNNSEVLAYELTELIEDNKTLNEYTVVFRMKGGHRSSGFQNYDMRVRDGEVIELIYDKRYWGYSGNYYCYQHYDKEDGVDVCLCDVIERNANLTNVSCGERRLNMSSLFTIPVMRDVLKRAGYDRLTLDGECFNYNGFSDKVRICFKEGIPVSRWQSSSSLQGSFTINWTVTDSEPGVWGKKELCLTCRMD